MSERTSQDEIDNDQNYIAFKAMEVQLKQEHMGKWVAFADGQLVTIAEDKEALFKKTKEMKITGFLFKEIVAEEKVYHFRSPKLFRG